MTPAKTKDVRVAAAQVIAGVLGGQSLNEILPAAIEAVAVRDSALLQQLCYGTLRDAPRLQALLLQLLAKPLRAKDVDLEALLLCGLYQLDAMRIPDHAAVAETVNATRKLKKPWAKGMTNAVLRRYQRESTTLIANLDQAARASHPAWLHKTIRQQWPEQAERIVIANNQQPPMTLRCNALATTRDEYLSALKEAGIEASAGELSDAAICLAQPRDVAELPGFGDGLASVQDEAAQMAAFLLGAASGERVLDACAAPGGKTCHILEQQPQRGELVAMDIDGSRLSRVEDNLARLDLQASHVQGDGAAPPAELRNGPSFDRILVDAPCSASGVIRRHPDIKLLRRESDIAGFAEQQFSILGGLWPLLAAGGCLLYVTCSIFHEENDGLLTRFCDAHQDAGHLPIDVAWGESTAMGRQLLPAAGGTDGMFFALLQKKD